MREARINHTGEVIVQDNITCTTESVLYLITCKKGTCGKQYLGQTGRPLYKRYSEHEDDAMDPNTNTQVGKHFQLPGHSTADIEMIPLEKVKTGGRAVREARERELIRKYQLAYYGLNIQT